MMLCCNCPPPTSHLLNRSTNCHKQTSALKTHTAERRRHTEDPLDRGRKVLIFGSYRSASASLHHCQGTSLSSLSSSSDVPEHPCNYICLNRGQILAQARRGRLYCLSSAACVNLQARNNRRRCRAAPPVYKANVCFRFSDSIFDAGLWIHHLRASAFAESGSVLP